MLLSFNCAFSTVIAGLDVVDIDKDILIQVCGMLGIYAASFLRDYGGEVVTVVDVRSDRLEMVKKLGRRTLSTSRKYQLTKLPMNYLL